MLSTCIHLVFAFTAFAAASAPSPPAARAANPRQVHGSALVIDTHADTPQRLLDEDFDLGTDTPVTAGHFDLKKVRQGNLGAEFFSIWVNPTLHQGHFAHRALQLIDSVYQQVRKHPAEMSMAFSSSDILKVRSSSPPKLAVLMGIEGGHAIENDLRLLRDFYRLGVRYMTLTWSNTNEWADSSGDLDKKDITHHNGLTEFGKEVVREMNRLGMMVDISHVSDKTLFDTLAVTQAPVIASHSSARALTNHARNMTDEMLRAVAKNGGVVMVNFFSAFIDEDFRKAFSAQSKERDAAMDALRAKFKDASSAVQYREWDRAQKEWAAKIPRPPLMSLIDHIDHIVKTAGIEHVGLGSDFDGVSSLPQGIDSVADLPKITEALAARGYSSEQLRKILGGNLLRVFKECERVSQQLSTDAKVGSVE
jgi:membrane dipeptidase